LFDFYFFTLFGVDNNPLSEMCTGERVLILRLFHISSNESIGGVEEVDG